MKTENRGGKRNGSGQPKKEATGVISKRVPLAFKHDYSQQVQVALVSLIKTWRRANKTEVKK